MVVRSRGDQNVAVLTSFFRAHSAGVFAPLLFFLFHVGRNSENFAPPRPRKSFAD
jgi:hypothetical protein